MIRTALLSSIFLFANSVLAADAANINANDWHRIKEQDGVIAYKMRDDKSGLYLFKSVGVIEAPIDQVLSVVVDSKEAQEWVPKLMECEILDVSEFPDTFLQYSKYDVPWPMKDRVFISDVKIDVDPRTHRTEIRYTNTQHQIDYDPEKVVQGYIGGSTYTLVPTRAGFTHITAVSVVDPKGGVPAWLVNWVAESMPFDTMQRLRARLESDDLVLDENLIALYQE
ncbi:Uncharacterised protein [BD1-7 clade bacterium]|uniref:START domain-containing protein n=1 Tax=BD1-7 clade bacterium TaxID=2029982 RepID=A0A5S9QK30_9GAMM|nr:Uncharacterised protein [BD1-7 clade bacterium]CAA0120723.1 Uncharacterised protein [BD1-7 clade bacterium]